MRLFGKNRREIERESRQAGRLPPGQSITRKLPVMSFGPLPSIDLSTWDLCVFGEVAESRCWNWEEFSALPTVSVTVDIHCVTHWSRLDSQWEGVRFRDFVALCDLKPGAQYVIAHCDGGYTTNLPLEVMLADEVLLAYRYEGAPLLPEHGAPLRTLVPSRYFWKSAKHLRKLEFSEVDRPGFWEQGGYHNEGDPFKEQRFRRDRF
ncbi:MAG: sulfite oxidase-like oxidoreductase [Chloroflexi bacterium]|nr:sulfite oxidase-like oxidoreductase [Chloroflexota bacterium]